MFCVVIYVLYTNIVHKMSLKREKRLKRDFRLLKEKDPRSAIYILGGKCPEMINSTFFFFWETDSLLVSNTINAF